MHIKITGPHIPPVLEELTADSWQTEAQLEGVRFRLCDVLGIEARNLNFDEARLEKITAVQAKLERLQCADVVITHSDFSGALSSDGSFIRTIVQDTRAAGWDISRSTLKDVTFQDCKLDMANFRFSTLQRVRFIDCSFVETDFQGAKFNQVMFENCLLEKTEFANCEVKQLDVRSSQLVDIRGWQFLRGATVDMAQIVAIAPQLAGEIGLVIEA